MQVLTQYRRCCAKNAILFRAFALVCWMSWLSPASASMAVAEMAAPPPQIEVTGLNANDAVQSWTQTLLKLGNSNGFNVKRIKGNANGSNTQFSVQRADWPVPVLLSVRGDDFGERSALSSRLWVSYGFLSKAQWLPLSTVQNMEQSITRWLEQATTELTRQLARSGKTLDANSLARGLANDQGPDYWGDDATTRSEWNYTQKSTPLALEQKLDSLMQEAGFEKTKSNDGVLSYRFAYSRGKFVGTVFPYQYNINLFSHVDAKGLCNNCNFYGESQAMPNYDKDLSRAEKEQANAAFHQALDQVNRQLESWIKPYLEPNTPFNPLTGGDYSKRASRPQVVT